MDGEGSRGRESEKEIKARFEASIEAAKILGLT
jgi:hypothetical protein